MNFFELKNAVKEAGLDRLVTESGFVGFAAAEPGCQSCEKICVTCPAGCSTCSAGCSSGVI